MICDKIKYICGMGIWCIIIQVSEKTKQYFDDRSYCNKDTWELSVEVDAWETWNMQKYNCRLSTLVYGSFCLGLTLSLYIYVKNEKIK